MLTVAGLEEKKSQPVIWDKQTPFQASNCSCLQYMLTGQSPREAIFQSNQAGLQIIFVD